MGHIMIYPLKISSSPSRLRHELGLVENNELIFLFKLVFYENIESGEEGSKKGNLSME